MSERKIRAGYYRRYDGKVVYVVSLATDADTGEESVIWTTYPFAAVPRYYTSSKKSFCAFVEVDGERKAKYKRMLNMKISGEAVERLEEEGFRGPVRKQKNWQLDEAYDSRDYLSANNAGLFLPISIKSYLDGRLGQLEERLSSLAFRQAVEQDMVAGILADAYQFSDEDLRRRRAESVKNVKKTNGRVSLNQRVRGAWEEGDEWQD